MNNYTLLHPKQLHTFAIRSWLHSLAHIHGLHNRDRDLYSTRGVLVQLMPHVYWESPLPIKSTNEIKVTATPAKLDIST